MDDHLHHHVSYSYSNSASMAFCRDCGRPLTTEEAEQRLAALTEAAQN